MKTFTEVTAPKSNEFTNSTTSAYCLAILPPRSGVVKPMRMPKKLPRRILRGSFFGIRIGLTTPLRGGKIAKQYADVVELVNSLDLGAVTSVKVFTRSN